VAASIGQRRRVAPSASDFSDHKAAWRHGRPDRRQSETALPPPRRGRLPVHRRRPGAMGTQADRRRFLIAVEIVSADSITTDMAPLAYCSRCMCGGVIVCRGARVQPGPRPRPGGCGGRHRCRPGPDAPRPGSSQDARTCRPGKDRPEHSRHIAWPSAGIESLCVITLAIRGVVTHDNGKDHFPACSGEYFRGGRAGNARTGPAGAAGPGRGRAAGRGRRPAGTTPATGRPRHRAASRGISQRGLTSGTSARGTPPPASRTTGSSG
jgi:hypothetical protein